MKLEDVQVAVVGLGYVGLPLAVEFGKQRPVIGFDINPQRIEELCSGHDRTLEIDDDELGFVDVHFTVDEAALDDANFYIVTTPTPIDDHKQPDLNPVLSATETIGRHLVAGDIVVYESTVYPGATEERCVPVLERTSGLKFNQDFFVGYSPERINPGDKEHRVYNIVKITSGSTPETSELVDALYRSIVRVGTHRAPSIKVAEAAKVIENTQRDVNIALMNELAILFNRLDIDTEDVLQAAGSKWNFLPFRPGLVGGHCIGVDPYYLTYKAQEAGYHPEIILAGRRLNDSMGTYVVSQLIKQMVKQGIPVRGAKALILGLTFKENTPDLRNSRVIDIIRELEEYGVCVDVYDPWADPREAANEYGVSLIESPERGAYDAIVLAVAHKQFASAGGKALRAYGREDRQVLYDLKHALSASESDARL
ncbi:Vi polysaccharide biosynthesis UDP-N-acetylglucosamine C-6 dehydrogenase TviB [Propionimicrobium sp. PCR01-08-3]|uniref:Vi polysaccharide biosynthesis UDP-N-acetylglucosamine C-6 dehydrogenase TviB n=1 Tax=Propionimicrobium sp. PCR01-08-3 TaxID=3052086 RepID=UPI00255C2C4D|nr:Vi polysaccharide biosynthesis UDP-N-acetylglucosamine C-6 dehydrogenase TviB [Propionimicrobium sp. PCR01-08-3]WIY82993.1 Vi polysaccharide biosynthesis UDP-N-acetylglucosamine C-6 dehydrogenase TviB [Propionimicrobium sp. PCR01-08-3]